MSSRRGGGYLLVLPGMPAAAVQGADRIPVRVWAAVLADAEVRRRYYGQIWQGRGHWWWLGAIDGSGHGSIRAQGRQFSAHTLGWQLAHGLVQPGGNGEPVIRHACDNASCQRPACLMSGTRAENTADYQARRWRADSPLADIRGARGRAVAVRDAIRTALRAGADPEQAALRAVSAGIPADQQTLPW